MQLKEYQTKVLDKLDRFLRTLDDCRQEALDFAEFQRSRGKEAELGDFCRDAWQKLNEAGVLPQFRDTQGVATTASYLPRVDGTGDPIPSICMKIPTGGGKTLLAAAAIERINADFFRRQTGFVLWVVPSDSIYRQTWKALADRRHPYRQMLERASGGRVKMLEKMDSFTKQDVENYLCVMLLMLQSSARKSKETLRMFRDSGRFTTFFPEIDDHPATVELLQRVPNLEENGLLEADGPPTGVSLKQSLGNTLRLVRPIIILDEGHKAYSATAWETLNSFNPRFLLELSATPNTGKKRQSNILVDVPGTALKEEEMIKLPIELVNCERAGWKHTLTEAHEHLAQLGRAAAAFQGSTGRYIRPMLLIRVDRTGKDQRDKTEIHAEDAREFLVNQLGVRPEEIRVKSATTDEIADEDLLANTCDARYIITKDALREGWDCPFAYSLALLSRTTAKTALTQMIGRILRQPEATRTGVAELDSCHVFCFDQEVGEAVSAIRKGLEEEGMGDLGNDVRCQNSGEPGAERQRTTVKRAAAFSGLRVFLPRVLRSNGEGKSRLLDYDSDILMDLPWHLFNCRAVAEAVHLDDQDAIGRSTMFVDMETETEGQTSILAEAGATRNVEIVEDLDFAYLTRLLLDVVPNPWQGARILEEVLGILEQRGVSEQALFANRLALIKAMKTSLRRQVAEEAEKVFRTKLEAGTITFKLVVSGDDELNWELADTLEYFVSPDEKVLRKKNLEPLERYLFERIYQCDLNDLEKDVAWYLDGNDAVKWWHRLVAKQNYHLQGWQRDKVYPDFLACVRPLDDGGIRFTVLETKGEHLKGNDDTEYKRKLFELLTDCSEDAFEVGDVEWFTERPDKMIFRLLMEETWREEIEV